ncbi:MAG TPA: serine/threonine-protein kinase [Planctomycetota bacterium]|nr:serine/threonine-protein kinase [Planctomycetota bacterium]
MANDGFTLPPKGNKPLVPPPPPPKKPVVPPPPPPSPFAKKPAPANNTEETLPAAELPTIAETMPGKAGMAPPPPPRKRVTQADIPTLTARSGASMNTQAQTMVSSPSFASTIATQDLTSEKMLMPASRGTFQEKMVPTLGGIPLLSKLGQGGMGAVYLGFDPKTQREVAIKVLPFHMAERDPVLIDRFFREAQIAMKIQSPNLVSVTDAKEESGLCYIIMEFVSGSSAGGYLKQHRATGLSEQEALDICIAGTKGLMAAHKENIIHRDIKPDNILIPQNDKGALVFAAAKLADLGLARSEEHGNSLTGSQAAMGTPGYMSPEQARDARKCGKPADIFSMGACLYALLTGRPPFHGKSPMDIILDTMQKSHEPIGSLRPNVSPPTQALIDKCLQKNPQHRFKDAETLLKALQQCRDNIDKPEKHGKLVEQFKANAPAAEKNAPEEPYFDELTYQANAKPRKQDESLSAEARTAAEQKAASRKIVAAVFLAMCFGAGLAMFVMAPEEKPVATVVAPVPPKKDPFDQPKISAEEEKRLNTGMKSQDIKDDYQNRLAKSLDRVSGELDKAKTVEPIMPVSSVGHAAEKAETYSTPRILFGFFASVLGFAYLMYSRKAGNMTFGMCGAALILVSWIVPSFPLVIMIAGVAATAPVFLR